MGQFTNEYIVDDDNVDFRLDVYATRLLPDLSRSTIQKLCTSGHITVNGSVSRPSTKIKLHDRIYIDLTPLKTVNDSNQEIPVLYEDENCVVINKPQGVLSHSKGSFNPELTVATWLSKRISETFTGNRAGIVHRLDRATSGVMICAKNQETVSYLQKQFSQRKVKKIYHAIISGEIVPERAIIDMPIARNPKHPSTFRADPNGKKATTYYETLQKGSKYSLVILKPETGRTHQLRVHLSELHHPIVGDTMYGGVTANRLFLHALSLEITIPGGIRKTFIAPLPNEFTEKMSETNG